MLRLFILLADLEQVVQIYFQSLQTRTEVCLAIKILSDSKDWSQTIHIVSILYSRVKKEINFLNACAWERCGFFWLHQPF